MKTQDMEEEMAHRRNDRHGNPPLTRGPDPDKVAHHLAGGEQADNLAELEQGAKDALMGRKRKDGFTHESPIRAFAEFKVAGGYAIGKGFRPSLAHLADYLNALEEKEGWAMIQIILPIDQANDPTIIFSKVLPDFSVLFPDDQPLTRPLDTFLARNKKPDDPVNPVHYNGRACADIGERLSANGYQILKYVWRLGKKDEACVELGKALWYLESETALLDNMPGQPAFTPRTIGLKNPKAFLEDRIDDQPQFTQNIVRMLWEGYGVRKLRAIREAIQEQAFHMENGSGLAL